MTAHTLGPHVVGQRVVVRYLLPASSGPSATDLLGTCVSFSSAAIVVQPDAGGDPVTIPLEAVVTGKPVPPRPSHRLRVSPVEAQRRAMTLFPDLIRVPLGDWVLRSSATASARRANSVLAMGPAGVPDAFEAVVAHYTGLGQRPIAAVAPDSAEDELFTSHGWVLESDDSYTVFQLAGVSAVSRQLPTSPAPATLEESGSLVTARIGSSASGVAVLDGDWVGFKAIEVDPAARRQGLGLAVMAALVEWSAEHGATTAYLQVLGDNAPALGLYERLGFVEHHRYRYLAAPR